MNRTGGLDSRVDERVVVNLIGVGSVGTMTFFGDDAWTFSGIGSVITLGRVGFKTVFYYYKTDIGLLMTFNALKGLKVTFSDFYWL